MELFRLLGTVAVDNASAKQAINDVTSEASGAEGILSSVFSNIGSFAVKCGQVMATGLAVGTTAIAALTKSSLDSYGEYEQLVGGVETLFGAGGKSIEEYAASVGKTVDEISAEYEMLMNRQTTVFQNADNAYMTAGMSANEYMSTVTSFSASLIQSLGDNASSAADVANKAIVDMSDNANKMGTSMESIQNAYQGFAKQNFTMLDNLKLGYGGTKEEMNRLLRDAEELGGLMGGTFSTDSFADIIEAIHLIQTEIGITGTTSLEAGSTIQGSASSMGAAWKNLLTGLGDENKDLGGLINNLIGSATTSVSNMMPIIENILGGISEAIITLIPIISEKLPGMIETLLPAVVEGATLLITSLAAVLPDILMVLIDVVPQCIEQIRQSLQEAFPTLFSAIGDFFNTYVAPMLTQTQEMATSVLTEFGNKAKTVEKKFAPFKDSIISFVEDGLKLMVKEFETLEEILTDVFLPVIDLVNEALFTLSTTILPEIMPYLISIGEEFVKLKDMLLDAVNEHILPTVKDFIAMIKELWEENQDKVAKIAELFKLVFEKISEKVKWFNDNIIKGILLPAIEAITTFVRDNMDIIKGIFQAAFDMIGGIIDFFIALFKGDWEGMWDAIISTLEGRFDLISQKFSLAVEAIKSVFSPIVDFFGGLWEGIQEKFGSVAAWFGGTFSAGWQAVLDVFSAGGAIFEGITASVSDVFVTAVNFLIDGLNKVISKPFNTINDILNGISGLEIAGFEPFSGLWDEDPLTVPEIPKLYEGGVLEKGQVGLLEGDGAEAVVPLHNNKKWISKVADDFEGELGNSDAVVKKLDELIKAILNLKLYMNNDVLVGELVPAMDASLGNMYVMKGRGQ